MRALTLDYRSQTRISWVGIALLILGVAGAGALATQYLQIVDELAQTESDLRQQSAATRKKIAEPAAAGDQRKIAQEMKRARDIIFQLSTPWADLFASVESVNAPDVGLLGIESDVEKRRIKINAEARNADAMLRYLRELEGKPVLEDVYLQSHQIQQQDAQRPVRFVITATWVVTK